MCKAIQQNYIPVNIIKTNRDNLSEFIMHNFSEGIILTFSKVQRLNQFFKKNSRIDKDNYRPFNILSVISNIFVRLIFKQLFFEKVFSKYQYRYRKGHSTQQCLHVMIKKWGKCVE